MEYIIITCIALTVIILFLTYKLYKTNSSYEDKKAVHHILCIGNSITQHPYLESIGWKSDWGMAASSNSNDYCHILQNMLQKNNKPSTVTPLQFADWERDLTLDIDSLICNKIKGKDIVIIRLGENVQDKETFKMAIIQLIKYCQSKVLQVYITGCFWQDDEKETAIIYAAQQCHIKYIPLFWLHHKYKDKIYPKEGDTLMDIQGKPYKIEGKFIITHPNDYGMHLIAETIFENMKI